MRDFPIAFAHRGARAHAPENTLEAFRLALRLGANGLETDVWTTADDQIVIDHDGVVRRGFRQRPISSSRYAEIAPTKPLLGDMLITVPPGIDVSIDVKDTSAFEILREVLRSSRIDARRVWLCHPDLHELKARRTDLPEVRLVHSTRLKSLEDGPERHAARLAEHGIDAINMHHTEWNGGLVSLFHRFSVQCFAWDLQYEERLESLLRMGIDAVYSDHVDRMVDAYSAVIGCPPPAI